MDSCVLSLCPHIAEGLGTCWGLFYSHESHSWRLHPHNLVTTLRPHLQIPAHCELGFSIWISGETVYKTQKFNNRYLFLPCYPEKQGHFPSLYFNVIFPLISKEEVFLPSKINPIILVLFTLYWDPWVGVWQSRKSKGEMQRVKDKIPTNTNIWGKDNGRRKLKGGPPSLSFTPCNVVPPWNHQIKTPLPKGTCHTSY